MLAHKTGGYTTATWARRAPQGNRPCTGTWSRHPKSPNRRPSLVHRGPNRRRTSEAELAQR
eukprot:9579238-Lingulodinium_polyedra.AAC.1